KGNAPQKRDEQGKKKDNDKIDATVMCRRLSENMDGHHKALSVVHIPSREEEADRAKGRFREQLCKELRRMGAMGRSLLSQRERPVRGRWWRGKMWGEVTQGMPMWVVHQLETWKKLIGELEKRIVEEEKQLLKSKANEAIL